MLVLLLAAALLQSPAQQASALVDAGVQLANLGRFNDRGERARINQKMLAKAFVRATAKSV